MSTHNAREKVYLGDGRAITLGETVGRGGEGQVRVVVEWPALVAKIFHGSRGNRDLTGKLRAMLASPLPSDAFVGKPRWTWPQDLVFDSLERRAAVGYIMPRVAGGIPAHELYNPKARARVAPYFTWRHLWRAATNLASATDVVHARGYVIGDLNESNVLVDASALVTVIDTDSFQVVDKRSGQVFPCRVGKREYLAPELLGRDLESTRRTPDHDAFALTVVIFQLLMEGVHPFDGRYVGSGDPPDIAQRIKQGMFPHFGPVAGSLRPQAMAMELTSLPTEVAALFTECFVGGHLKPRRRPSARTWREVLARCESELTECSVNDQHVYWKRLRKCVWCGRQQAHPKKRDPFRALPKALRRTFALPPVRQFRWRFRDRIRAWVRAVTSKRRHKPLLLTQCKIAANANGPSGRWLRRVVSAALIGACLVTMYWVQVPGSESAGGPEIGRIQAVHEVNGQVVTLPVAEGDDAKPIAGDCSRQEHATASSKCVVSIDSCIEQSIGRRYVAGTVNSSDAWGSAAGYVGWVLKQAGLATRGSSYAGLTHTGRVVLDGSRQTGDILLYSIKRNGRVTFASVYWKDDIHVFAYPKRGEVVAEKCTTKFFLDRLVQVRRVVGASE